MLPRVATILPLVPLSLCPRKIDMFTARIPGADCEIASTSIKSSSLIQPLLSTTSFCIIGIMAYPPPIVKAPILAKQVNMSR